VLHKFRGNSTDGAIPSASLIFDGAGNLYGTTSGLPGTVFKLTRGTNGWTEKVLDYFTADSKGFGPYGGVVFDGAGNLYGTTYYGGGHAVGDVFELTKSAGWAERVLHHFTTDGDGRNPSGTLIFDTSGNLYGTTDYGGAAAGGTVFEVTP